MVACSAMPSTLRLSWARMSSISCARTVTCCVDSRRIAAAIAVATAGDFPTGTYLGYVAIGLSVLAVVVGVTAVIIGHGRVWAVPAIAVAVLANPWVLLTVLRFLSGLQTG